MKIHAKALGAFSIFLIGLCFVVSAAAQEPLISTAKEIKEDIEQNVCLNADRLEAVKKLFRQMGATDKNMKVEKIKDVSNVVVTHKGKTEETVVIGAHYDKVSSGCGALDNWTGIVVLANLYRTISYYSTQKTYIFVAFGDEEPGLLGSSEMARAIPKEQRANYCAMINFDSFGLAYPQAMTNISDAKLVDLAKEVADEMKMPFAQAGINGASSDSESFRKQKIPGITLHGMSGAWQRYLHGANDKVENVSVKSVYYGYQFTLNYLTKLDTKGCGDFRK